MENSTVVDILNILEVNLAIPGRLQDLVGGLPGVVSLYNDIENYLKDKGLDPSQKAPEPAKTVYAISVVNSDGYASGKDSDLTMYPTLRECVDGAYASYVSVWEESAEVLDDGESFLSKDEFEKELLDSGSVCIQCLDAHVSFDYFEQEITFDRGREDIIADVKRQLVNKENETSYGEPQAWAELPSGRSIEVTLEQEGLPESEHFYCVRLHCSEAEFDNKDFDATNGIIDFYTSSGNDPSELDSLIHQAIACDESHPVGEHSAEREPLDLEDLCFLYNRSELEALLYIARTCPDHQHELLVDLVNANMKHISGMDVASSMTEAEYHAKKWEFFREFGVCADKSGAMVISRPVSSLSLLASEVFDDKSAIYSVSPTPGHAVDVKVCAESGLVYVMQNEDGSTVYSMDDADTTFPQYVYDEESIVSIVKQIHEELMERSSKSLPLDERIQSAADKASALQFSRDEKREVVEPFRN